MTFEISPGLEELLQAQAEEQGVSIEELVDASLDILTEQSSEAVREALDKVRLWRSTIEEAKAEAEAQVLRYSEAVVLLQKAKRGEEVVLEEVIRLLKRNQGEPEQGIAVVRET